MHPAPLRQFDLNLLRVLHAVVREGSVTRAAARLHRTPSAISHALERLRRGLDDPLFERAGHSMIPTAKALEAADEIETIMVRLDAVLFSPSRFNPGRLARTFQLGMSDYAAAVALGPLVPRLRDIAPAVKLVVRHLGRDDGTAAVRQGSVDLAIGVFPGLTADLKSRSAGSDRYNCAIWQGSRASRQPLDLEQYLSLEHLNILVRGDSLGLIDNALAQQGLARRIAMVVPHFLVAPRLLRGTDLVLTAPARLLQSVAADCELTLFEPPISLPHFPTQFVWASRNASDPALAWLIEELGQALGTEDEQ